MTKTNEELAREWLDANIPGHVTASTDGYVQSLATLFDAKDREWLTHSAAVSSHKPQDCLAYCRALREEKGE